MRITLNGLHTYVHYKKLHLSRATMLILLITLAALSICAGHGSGGNMDELQGRADMIRKALNDPGYPGSSKKDLHLALATTLQQLNFLQPNGGRRIPEAEQSYR